LLDTLITAIDRRHELFALVENAASRDEAVDKIAGAFSLSRPMAVAVTDMQIRRFTAGQRAELVRERDSYHLTS